MNSRKIYFILILILVMGNTFGCANAPETSETDGMQYAVKKNEKSVADILGEDVDNELPIQISEDGACKVSLGTGRDTLNIDTIFADMDYSKVKIAEVVPLKQAFDRNAIAGTFFSGEKIHEIHDIQAYDEENAHDRDGIVMEKKSTVEHAVHLENDDGTVIFVCSSDSNLFFENTNVEDIYNRMSKDNGTYVTKNNVNDQYTIDVAWKELETALSALGIQDMEVGYYKGCADGGEVYYSMEFTPKIYGLPLAEQLNYGTATEQVPIVYGTADVGTSGIGNINMNNMLWEISDSSETNVITPEQLIKVLEWYVSTGEIPCDSDIVFEHVELMYMITTEDWNDFTLQPIWRIYIPLAEAVMKNEIENIDISWDIVIDAVTGELIWYN